MMEKLKLNREEIGMKDLGILIKCWGDLD